MVRYSSMGGREANQRRRREEVQATMARTVDMRKRQGMFHFSGSWRGFTWS